MRKSLFQLVFCFAFALNGCSTTHQAPHAAGGSIKPGDTLVSFVTPKYRPKQHGTTVAVYSREQALQRPYRIIGKEIVSRYNFIGLERQNRSVNDIMQKLAASMGGDAIINVTADNQKIEGTVISYEKALL